MTETARKFPQVARALEAGGTLNLFREFASWSRADIEEIGNEIDAFDALADEEYGKLALSPGFFLSKSRSESLDASRFEIFCVLAEIMSVAVHFLEQS